MSDDKALRIWLFIAFLVVALCATGIFYESYLDKQKRQQEIELAWEYLEPRISPWMWWDTVGHNLADGDLHNMLLTAGPTMAECTTLSIWEDYDGGSSFFLPMTATAMPSEITWDANQILELTDGTFTADWISIEPQIDQSGTADEGHCKMCLDVEGGEFWIARLTVDGEFIGGIKVIAPGRIKFEGDWEEFLRLWR